ncbi:MAG: hypothetical protein PHG49_00790 [Candidatus Pacebacteria bacterium]|nr:hypothetical protein [Candidatus Paceibacterota bacterium]
MDEFKIDISKLKVSGALFDFDKLDYFSREFIAKLSADGVYNYVLG